MNQKSNDLSNLDKEWIELIIEAKNMGINKKDILDFLHMNGVKDHSNDYNRHH